MTAPTNTGASLSHHIGATGRFILRAPSGEVQITATESETATVRARDGRDLS